MGHGADAPFLLWMIVVEQPFSPQATKFYQQLQRNQQPVRIGDAGGELGLVPTGEWGCLRRSLIHDKKGSITDAPYNRLSGRFTSAHSARIAALD